MEPLRVLVTGGSGFIGTNLMTDLIAKGAEVVNLDWNPPLDPVHRPWWKECDLMDIAAVTGIFHQFKPKQVVHLAARTDTDEQEDLNAYAQNHEGTRILLRVIAQCPSVERLIVTSTQFVCEAGYQPKHDQDFKPFTLYGESKRLTEIAAREADLPFPWTIIRPTTVWGPYSLRYRDLMFKVMRKGMYFHPGRRKVVRSYGYVGNVVWQIERILELPADRVNGRVFYVGDRPFDLRVWVEAVSKRLTGRPVRYIPSFFVHVMAIMGDLLGFLRLPFPINSRRYKSMTSDYVTPMDDTIAVLGEAPFDLEQGVERTIRWYDSGSERFVAPTRIDTRAAATKAPV